MDLKTGALKLNSREAFPKVDLKGKKYRRKSHNRGVLLADNKGILWEGRKKGSKAGLEELEV